MRPTSEAKDIILLFLQDFFGEQDLYDGKNDFLWNPDSEISKILIADSYTEDLERTDFRPAIILRRGPIRWMNTSLDQRRFTNFRTGSKSFMDLIHSDLTLECLSRNGLEAELLADIVFQGVQFFANIIRGRGAFEVDSVAIGPETLIQSDSQQELTAVPVGVRLLIQHAWTATPDAERLERIRLRMNDLLSGRQLHEAGISKDES